MYVAILPWTHAVIRFTWLQIQMDNDKNYEGKNLEIFFNKKTNV